MKLWPLVVYFFGAAGLAAAMLVLSYVLGERHHDAAMREPFESGVLPLAYARVRFSAKFYLVAMLFVIFDLESVFVFAWAIAAREVGWAGYFEILIFIGVLIAALVYLLKLGALDWAPAPRLSTGATAPPRTAPAANAPGARTARVSAFRR